MKRTEKMAARHVPEDQAAGVNPLPEIATEWFWETDSSHRYSYVSSQNAVITGFSASQIIGRRREDFALDRDDPKWERHLADLAAHRPFWGFEYPIKLPDGRLVHLSVSGEPRFDADGKFLGYRGAASDITERKRVEQELRDARELFQAVLDHAPFGIALKDKQGRYVEVSREWQRRFGMAREKVIGKTPSDALPPDIGHAYEAQDVAALQMGDEIAQEERLEQSDGGDKFFLTTRFPTRDRDGNIAGMCLVSIDITERKLAELAHTESEQQIRAIADNLPVLIARHDSQWRHRFINREGASWYGVDPEQLVGKAVPDLLSRETCEVIRPLVDRVLCGEASHYSGTVDYPDGKSRQVMINYVPDIAADGSIQGWFSLAVDVTERERAQRALWKNERQLSTIADNLPVLISRFDREGRFEFINRAGEEWYGRPTSEIVGRTITEIFSPESCAKVKPWVERALKGERVRFEERMHYPDGRYRDVDIAYIPDCGADGEIIGCFALVQDISERKSAEQALRQSEARLQAIVKYAPAGVYLKDLEGRFLVANPKFASWVGREAADIAGKRSDELFAESEASRFLAHDRAVIRERRLISMEDHARAPDGAARRVLISKFPVLDDAGEITAVGGVDLDITEFKNVEQALRESETRLKAVVDNLPAFITYVSRDLRYRFANRVAEEWYGRPASEIIGRELSEIHKPASLEKLRPRVDAVLAGQDQRFETSLLYPDDVTRTVDQRWIADKDEQGHVRGWFSLIQDISERKRLEADLLRQERLAAMGQLTGTVAHELRNPLGAVAASVAAIRRLSRDAGFDLERSLSRAERGVARSDRIITELLDFARAKGLQRESTQFGEWLSNLLSEEDIFEGVTVSVDLNIGEAQVSMDREDFRRAVINVVDNACQAAIGKHGPDSPEDARIEIAARLSRDRLVCEIRDNGPGIPAENLSRVMEPLFSTKSFGTGLGLPTVQRIMEEHGGGIEIESAPGEGALVKLWLPLDGHSAGDHADVRPETTCR